MSESITKELREYAAEHSYWRRGTEHVTMNDILPIADRIDERFDRELTAKQEEVDGFKADMSDLQAKPEASILLPMDESESITKELRSVNAVTLTEMLASGKWDGYRAVFMSTTLRGSIADRIDERFTHELQAKQEEVEALKSDNADLQARLDASIPVPVDADGVPWTCADVDKPFALTDGGKATEGLVREIAYGCPRKGWWVVDQYDTHYPADKCRHVAPEPTETIEDIERDASDVAPDAYRPRMIPYDELDGLSAEMAKSIDIARRAYEQGKRDGAGGQA